MLAGPAERHQIIRDAHDPEHTTVSVDDGHATCIGRQGEFLSGAGAGVGRDSRAVLGDLGCRTIGVEHSGDVCRGERTHVVAVVGEDRHPAV